MYSLNVLKLLKTAPPDLKARLLCAARFVLARAHPKGFQWQQHLPFGN